MFVNGMGVWHVGLLGLFALVVVLVVVLVVALVASASRQSPPPSGGVPGQAPAGWPHQPPTGDPSQPHAGYATPGDPAGSAAVAPYPSPGAPAPDAASPAGAATPAAPRSVEQRLADLEDLHRRGVINADEYAAGRIRILGEL